jgi:hypothetical protein
MNPLKKLNVGIIDGENNNETANSNSTATTSPSMHSNIPISYIFDIRIIQNFRLVWLDSSIDEINE